MTIGDSIRAARKSRGLTQNELAHAMGITGSAIGQYECGVRIPKYETVERISSALSVPTSSLMPVVSSEIERLTARCARYAEEIAVAHGRIVGSLEDGRYRRRFSCCGEDATMITEWAWPKYCPNCGAKIDG